MLYEEIIKMIVLKNGLIKIKTSVISNLFVQYTYGTQIKKKSLYCHETILKWYKNQNN